MKIGVVGIGGAGSAAARFLSKSGHTVVGFEQFRIGHDRGSSHGESRIIRYTYPDLLYTHMMGDAYPLWEELEQAVGEDLFVRCGGLFFGAQGDSKVEETERSLAAAGLPYEKLDAKAMRKRFPAFLLYDNEVALFQSESGFLRSTSCVLANARLAREYGATLHEDMAVQDILSRGDTAIVRTKPGGEYNFDRVIVTAGAWMSKLFASLRLPLSVTRQQILYLRIARNESWFVPGALPVWIDATSNWYGFPADGRIEGVKLALHQPGEITDPDAPQPPVDEESLQNGITYAIQRLPDLSDQVTHAQTCLYTNTPDEHFIIDRAPQAPNVWLLSGCSGHGFKFTLLLGRIAADLATGGTYHRDLSRFSLRRFRDMA